MIRKTLQLSVRSQYTGSQIFEGAEPFFDMIKSICKRDSLNFLKETQPFFSEIRIGGCIMYYNPNSSYEGCCGCYRYSIIHSGTSEFFVTGRCFCCSHS